MTKLVITLLGDKMIIIIKKTIPFGLPREKKVVAVVSNLTYL